MLIFVHKATFSFIFIIQKNVFCWLLFIYYLHFIYIMVLYIYIIHDCFFYLIMLEVLQIRYLNHLSRILSSHALIYSHLNW